MMTTMMIMNTMIMMTMMRMMTMTDVKVEEEIIPTHIRALIILALTPTEGALRVKKERLCLLSTLMQDQCTRPHRKQALPMSPSRVVRQKQIVNVLEQTNVTSQILYQYG